MHEMVEVDQCHHALAFLSQLPTKRRLGTFLVVVARGEDLSTVNID